MAARYRSIVSGLIVGCVSLFLTLHLNSLFAFESSIVMRTLKAAGVALVVPGVMVAFLAGNVHGLRLSLVAAVNFLFWFGFGWLFATFIAKLIALRRAFLTVGAPSEPGLREAEFASPRGTSSGVGRTASVRGVKDGSSTLGSGVK